MPTQDFKGTVNGLTMAIGAANLKRFMNAGGTDQEWANGIAMINSTRDTSAVNATIAYAGVGFKPSLVIMLMSIPATSQASIGFGNGTSNYSLYNDAGEYGAGIWSPTVLYAAFMTQTGVIRATAEIMSMDADGFSVRYINAGAKTGIASLLFLALR